MAVIHPLPTGDELRALRESHGLTQAQVAQAMGSTQQHVSVIEGKASVRAKTADRYRRAVYAYTDTEKGAA